MQNRFEILQHNKTFREGSFQPPRPRNHGGDMNLRVRPRVKYIDLGVVFTYWEYPSPS